MLRHPRLRVTYGKKGIMRRTHFASYPAVVMAMIVDSVGKRRSAAYLADTKLGRLGAPVLDEAVSFDERHT